MHNDNINNALFGNDGGTNDDSDIIAIGTIIILVIVIHLTHAVIVLSLMKIVFISIKFAYI